jgi:ribosomal-protein-alanine N-acetyltransferase
VAASSRGAILQRGDRVVLRAPRPSDGDELIARSCASRDLHRGWVKPPRNARDYAGYLARLKQPDMAGLLACRSEDEAIVGVVNLNQIFHGSLKSAYLGYYALEPFAGQGYLREAVGLAVRHAFRALRLHRVEANIQPENEASRQIAMRNGFRLEGYSPRYLKVAGRWRDHERWARRADADPAHPNRPAALGKGLR